MSTFAVESPFRSSPVLVIRGEEYGEPWSEDAMRFRLLYSGQLFGTHATKTRSEHKHEIRKRLSPQLERLWESKSSLRSWLQRTGYGSRSAKEGPIFWSDEEREKSRLVGLEVTANRWKIQEGRFIPLVTADIIARCRIDILFLLPEEKGYILQGGDLDNRIKTLFDALRMPKPNEECGNDERPCFVLLEDDSLIAEVSIVTDNLLMLPNESAIGPNDAFLVVDVQLETREAKFDESQWMK